MNQFFSFKRFSLLVLKHWAENKKRYTLTVLALVGLLITWFAFTIIIGDDSKMSADIQFSTYFFPLYVLGTFYASQYFRDLGWRGRGISFLLVPASAFEKFLCALLYVVVGFFLVFTAAFYLIDSLIISLYNSFSQDSGTGNKAVLVNVFNRPLFGYTGIAAIYFVPLFFAVQSLFLLGSLYFRKYNYIKTVITGFLVFIVGFATTFLVYDLCSRRNGEELVIHRDVPAWVLQMLSIVVMYVIAPVFWLAAYKRFKSKQV